MANYKVVDADQLDADLAQVANAVRGKSGTAEALTFPEGFVSSVNAISTGVDTSGDTVKADTLSEGITAHDAAGAKITGTMKYRIFEGEIVSTVIAGAYAVLCKDPIIAEHFNDSNLWIKVRYDIEPTQYAIVETWGFNTSGNFDVRIRTGQTTLRYDGSGNLAYPSAYGIALNGVQVEGANNNTGNGYLQITEDGELRMYPRSGSYKIIPSKYTVEVHWHV